MSDFVKRVDCWPSRNWVKADPSRNYGITNMRMAFYLTGPKGTVQFMLGTEWGVKSVRDHVARFPVRDIEDYRKPMGWDLGYHSHAPMYEGQGKMGSDCELTGGDCYYDGSSLQADEMIEGFLAGGTDWLWPKLEEVYRARFEAGPWPDFTPQYKPHPDDALEQQ